MRSYSVSPVFPSIYFSYIYNTRVRLQDGRLMGRLADLLASNSESGKVLAAVIKTKEGRLATLDWSGFSIDEHEHKYSLVCRERKDFTADDSVISFRRQILDQQIVDINDKKLVRVNDIRLVFLSSGLFPVAVDVGWSGILRRLGVVEITNDFLQIFNRSVPSRLIAWNNIGFLSQDSRNIKLSVSYSKLHTLHPSDLSDIIEELDRKTGSAVFASLDDEKAADVLEEMEDGAKVSLVEDLPVEKAADVLEKMPTDEVADILDDLEKERAEELLKEMDQATSCEVRELMEYPEDTVGSLMTTDFVAFTADTTVDAVFEQLRKTKPESDTIYSIYVTDQTGRLQGSVSLPTLAVSAPQTTLAELMDAEPKFVYDTDKLNVLLKLLSKYSMLVVPVVSSADILIGTIVIDDVIYRLFRKQGVQL